MDLPIYHEQKISEYSKDQLEGILLELPMGKKPLILLIDHFNQEKQLDFLDHFSNFIDRKNISVNIPYPTFVISSVHEVYRNLNIVGQIDEVPSFFMHPYKQPHVKEVAMLEKLALKESRLKGVNLSRAIQRIDQYAKGHRELELLCHEGHFYETLLNFMTNQKNYG